MTYRSVIIISLGFLLLSAPCSAKEVPKRVNFDELALLQEECDRQEGCLIQINGFLYSTPDNKIILSPEPNLKSCCVGSRTKRSKQILLSGSSTNLPHRERVVTVVGKLKMTTDGEHLYNLSDAHLIDGTNENALSLAAGSFFILSCGAAGYLFIKRRNQR